MPHSSRTHEEPNETTVAVASGAAASEERGIGAQPRMRMMGRAGGHTQHSQCTIAPNE